MHNVAHACSTMIDCIQAAAGSHDRRSKDTKRGRIFAAFTYLDKYRHLLCFVDNLRFVRLTKAFSVFLGVYPSPKLQKGKKNLALCYQRV